MPQSYTPEFKKKIVRLHEEEGRTYKSITAEYGVSKASISKWCSEFSKECQTKALTNPDSPNDDKDKPPFFPRPERHTRYPPPDKYQKPGNRSCGKQE